MLVGLDRSMYRHLPRQAGHRTPGRQRSRAAILSRMKPQKSLTVHYGSQLQAIGVAEEHLDSALVRVL